MIEIIIGLGILLISIIVHEIGHKITLEDITKKQIKIRFYYNNIRSFGFKTGYPSDYNKLNKEEKITVYASGIVIGMMPIIIATMIKEFYILILPGYIIGCMKDIDNIIKLKIKK